MPVIELPSNVEAERSVLGCVLFDPNCASIVFNTLTEDDFSDADPRNKILFRAINELDTQKKPIEVQTVIGQLAAMKLDKAFGDYNYILELLDKVFTSEHLETYIGLVKEQSVLRRMLLKLSDIQNQYAKGVDDIGAFISQSNDEITQIAQSRAAGKMLHASEVADAAYNKIMASTQIDNRGLTGVDTGYSKLNNYTHGWQKGELIIIAARPGMGKTAFALNLAVNAALRSKVPVAFFSLEMSKERIMERILASKSRVTGNKLSTGYGLTPGDKAALKVAKDLISETNIYFDDTPDSKLGDVINKATDLKKKQPNLGLVVIDYLSRIKGNDRPGREVNRSQEIGEITGALKSLSRNLELPVICLAQLNRNVEQGDTKVPSLSHLRESGNIEQDADMVLLLYREDYYTSLGQSVKAKGWGKGKQQEQQPQKPAVATKQESTSSDTMVMVAKNRNGSTGTVHLIFEKDISNFVEPSPEYEAAYKAMSGNSFEGE